jgi:hypothetical protein
MTHLLRGVLSGTTLQTLETAAVPFDHGSLGSGKDAWPNAYRQPLAPRTYVSLNHSLRSNGLPSRVP